MEDLNSFSFLIICLAVSLIFSRLSSFLISRAVFTWKSQAFPTTQIAEHEAFIKDDKEGSFSALLPVFFVIPKAVKILLLRLRGFEKNSVSTGFAPGQPPSM